MSFASLDLHPDLLSALQTLGFTQPTPIQTKAIPPAMQGRDVLACAMTGSGKTAGFLLPILQQLLAEPERRPDGPRGKPPRKGRVRCLVLTPTRELAAQILADFQDLARNTRLTGAAVFGGVGMGPQEQAFRNGVDVLVATPGRLLDHLSRRYARLHEVEHLVLDEADRMLDMGFLPDIRRVLQHVPEQRQTLFFSATMPKPIVELSRKMLQDPERIDIERRSAPATGVAQALYPVPQLRKQALLIELLDTEMTEALVFTRTKHRADRVCKQLVKAGVDAERIHGNRTQGQRTRALAGFKDGTYRVLVATDIAARGIDVEALGHVVNFDVPRQPEDYIHRVGRTGRASATGEAFTFVAPDEENLVRDIERAVGRTLPRLTVEGFDYTAPPPQKQGGGGSSPRGRVGKGGSGAPEARFGKPGGKGSVHGGGKRRGKPGAKAGGKPGARSKFGGGKSGSSGGRSAAAGGGSSSKGRGIGAIERGRSSKRRRP